MSLVAKVMARAFECFVVWLAIVVPVCSLISAAYFLPHPFDWMAMVCLAAAGIIVWVVWDDVGVRS